MTKIILKCRICGEDIILSSEQDREELALLASHTSCAVVVH